MVNIPDVKYKLSYNSGCACGRKGEDIIFLGLPQETCLTDDELMQCLGDSITHEYIHHILNHIFPYEISFLFDAIADHLRLHLDLLRQMTREDRHDGAEVWIDIIENEGFEKGLLDHYFILDRDKVKQLLEDGI